MSSIDYENLLSYFMTDLVLRHKMPWRIEFDWAVEVYDANDRLVMKVRTVRDAYDLIEIAKDIDQVINSNEFDVNA